MGRGTAHPGASGGQPLASGQDRGRQAPGAQEVRCSAGEITVDVGDAGRRNGSTKLMDARDGPKDLRHLQTFRHDLTSTLKPAKAALWRAVDARNLCVRQGSS